VLIYPAYLEKDGILLDEVAPANVPVFAYVAADDSHAPSSRAFSAACEARGIPCELHIPASGGHGFGLKADRPESVRDWPERLCAFLGKQA
jgi:acetyl esterase/lipase